MDNPIKLHVARLTEEELAAAAASMPDTAVADEWMIVTPIPFPANGLPPDVSWKVDGVWKKPDAVWPYRTMDGLVGYAVRWDLPRDAEGEKPVSISVSRCGAKKAMAKPAGVSNIFLRRVPSIIRTASWLIQKHRLLSARGKRLPMRRL
jgi:hypothetical protein